VSDPNYGCTTGTCAPCEINGTATCSGDSCLVTGCSSGYHLDANRCAPNVPEDCANNKDDDGDTRADCLDTDCNASPSCTGKCIDAASIACDSVIIGQSTNAAGSTQRVSSYSCAGGAYPGREYAYRLTGAGNQRVYAELYGLSGNLGLFRVGGVTGSQCSAATACGAYADAMLNARAEALGFTVPAGEDTYIVVDGAAVQNYSLSVQCSAVDGCWPVKPIEAGQSFSATNNPNSGAPNVSANKVQVYDCYATAESGPEAAWIFTPTVTASYRVNVTALSADCDVFVLAAGDCGGTCLGPASRSVASDRISESITFNGLANTTYYIVVDGYEGAVCTFNLAMTQL